MWVRIRIMGGSGVCQSRSTSLHRVPGRSNHREPPIIGGQGGLTLAAAFLRSRPILLLATLGLAAIVLSRATPLRWEWEGEQGEGSVHWRGDDGRAHGSQPAEGGA